MVFVVARLGILSLASRSASILNHFWARTVIPAGERIAAWVRQRHEGGITTSCVSNGAEEELERSARASRVSGMVRCVWMTPRARKKSRVGAEEISDCSANSTGTTEGGADASEGKSVTDQFEAMSRAELLRLVRAQRQQIKSGSQLARRASTGMIVGWSGDGKRPLDESEGEQEAAALEKGEGLNAQTQAPQESLRGMGSEPDNVITEAIRRPADMSARSAIELEREESRRFYLGPATRKLSCSASRAMAHVRSSMGGDRRVARGDRRLRKAEQSRGQWSRISKGEKVEEEERNQVSQEDEVMLMTNTSQGVELEERGNKAGAAEVSSSVPCSKTLQEALQQRPTTSFAYAPPCSARNGAREEEVASGPHPFETATAFAAACLGGRLD